MSPWHKLFSRNFGIVCMLVLIGTSLTGCSDTQTILYSKNDTNITFSWWGNDARHVYTMEGVDQFQLIHPEIDVEYRYGEWNGFEKRNKVWMESNTEADVMQINFAWLSQYSPDGNGYYDLYQLADYIDLDNFTKEDLELAEINGHLNAIPIAYNTQIIADNQDVYDKYGLDIPSTWDDYLEAAKVMQADGVYPLGMVKKQVFMMLMTYYEQKEGHAFFHEDGSLAATKAEIEELLTFYCSLIDNNVLMPIDQFNQEQFMTGNVATSMFWISDTGNYCVKAEEQGRTVVLGDYPVLPGALTVGRYVKPATLYAISDNSKNPEAAAELLNYLLNSTEMAELQGTEKGVPISQAAYSYLEETEMLSSWQTSATEKMMQERDQMSVMIPMMENDTVIDLFKTTADDYRYEQIELSEAAQIIYDGIRELN